MQERFICTKENPWTPDKSRAIHPDAIVIQEDYGSLASGGSYELYECPNCGLKFWVTLPD